MSWPVPVPGVVADRMSAGFEQAFSTDENGLPLPQTVDARSPNSPFRVIAVASDESHQELYLYQASLAEELMVDTAEDWLQRHADIWGVPRNPALPAVGRIVLQGATGTAVPSGIAALSALAVEIDSTAAGAIDPTNSISVPAQAAVAGAAGNMDAGTILTLVSPVAGLTSQSAVVDVGGMAGGLDQESLDSWRANILRRIRAPAQGGDQQDWTGWAKQAGAAWVAVYPLWQGAGTVGVIVLMADGTTGLPRVPTASEMTRISVAIDEERPVTSEPVVVPGALLPVPVTLSISPDTVNVRAAATAALQAYFAAEAAIGATLPFSRLDAAVSAAAGDYSNHVTLPAGDVVPAPYQMPVLGPISFVSA